MTASSPDPDSRDAADQLARAEQLAESTHAKGWRWVRIYLSGWAAGSVGLVLLVGLGGRTGAVVGIAAFAALVLVGVSWSARRGVSVAEARQRIGLGAGLWAAAYGVVLAVGLPDAGVWFWVVAAPASAVPLLAAAWLPARPRSEAATT